MGVGGGGCGVSAPQVQPRSRSDTPACSQSRQSTPSPASTEHLFSLPKGHNLWHSQHNSKAPIKNLPDGNFVRKNSAIRLTGSDTKHPNPTPTWDQRRRNPFDLTNTWLTLADLDFENGSKKYPYPSLRLNLGPFLPFDSSFLVRTVRDFPRCLPLFSDVKDEGQSKCWDTGTAQTARADNGR